MTDVNRLIFELWKTTFEQRFQHHPDRRNIMQRLSEGEFTSDDVDRWFAEAEHHSFKHLLLAAKKRRSTSAVFHFEWSTNGNS